MNAPAPPAKRPMPEPPTTSSPATPLTPKRQDDDEEDEWRHEPVAPVDERNPLRSLGKAVSDAVLGGDDATAPAAPKR